MSAPEEPVRRTPGTPDEGRTGIGRRVLTWVSALTLIGLMVGAGHLFVRLEPEILPVRVVSIEGDLRRLPVEQLQEAVAGELVGGILTQDLGALKAAAEALAWVDTASLRRVWPDRLVLSVREHEPLAHWGDDGLVTAAGVVFRPESGELPRGLPDLAGPDAHAAEVVARYGNWRPALETVGLGIVSLSVDARGAWTLETDAGFTLVLGKNETEARVERFLDAYPALAAAGPPTAVDMRYANGLAVSWRSSGDGGQSPRAAADAQQPPKNGLPDRASAPPRKPLRPSARS